MEKVGKLLGVRRRWSAHGGGASHFPIYQAMNVENRPLVTDESVEFQKQPVKVQDIHEDYYPKFKTNVGIYLEAIKRNTDRCEHVTGRTLHACFHFQTYKMMAT